MQVFTCPFCGARDETEFFFGGEAGNDRPEPTGDVSAERWADYLHVNANAKGGAAEIWVHLTCGEFFVMRRDTVTHEVIETRALRGSAA
jgi:sarcosine oxidase subunit delta